MTDIPDVAAPEKSETKSRFRIGCVGVCIGLFFLFMLTWVGAKVWWEHVLDSKVQAYRDAGEPMTLAEVVARVEPIPDEENAALVLIPHLADIHACVETPTGRVVNWRSEAALGSRPSAEMLKLMRALMDDGRGVMAVLHDAARHERGRWPANTDPASYQDADIAELRNLRSAVRLLNIESELRAAEGDWRGAAQSVRAQRRLGASLDEDPRTLRVLVGIAATGAATAATERVLALGELPASDLTMLSREFASEAQQVSMQQAIRTERAGILWTVTEGRHVVYSRLDAWTWNWMSQKGLDMLPGYIEGDAISGLEHMTEWVKLFDLPPREMLSRADAQSGLYDLTFNKPRSYLSGNLSGRLTPALGRMTKAFVGCKQRVHVARTMLTVERFRMENHRWPEKLADLVPTYIKAVPEDWFAPQGTPISYTHTPEGVRLASRYTGGSYLLGEPAARDDLVSLADDIGEYAEANGRLPDKLSDLVPEYRAAIPTIPDSGYPYTYVTKADSPQLFVLAWFTDGKDEADFWKLKITTRELVHRFRKTASPITFRLLNPELRGVKQAPFADEVDVINSAYGLHILGYTFERLKELGLSDAAVGSYKDMLDDMEIDGEKAFQQPDAPDVPPDTPIEATP